jgi:hypothetical protein
MFLISKTANNNYLAKIIRLNNLRKHNNADRLQVVTIDGNNVITDLKAKEGDIYVFFPLECTLNKEFLSWSNSFEDNSQNTNKDSKGFFNKHGRVRAIKLRGEKSEGYIVPLTIIKDWLTSKYDYLIKDFTDEEVLGVEFDSYNDIVLCEKYIPRITNSNGSHCKKNARVAKISRLIDNQFRFHIDTSHLKKHINKINPEDTISITKKLHGTSFVVAKILCNKKLSFSELLLSMLGIDINNKEYQTIWSSRNMVKNANRNLSLVEKTINQIRFWIRNPSYFLADIKGSVCHPIKSIKSLYYSSSNNHFYNYDLWEDIAKKIEHSLVDGITLYGEAVGYTRNNSYIQKPYDYGCVPGEFKAYIYRATMTNSSGFVIELSAQQTKSYCEKYNLNYVPEIYHGKARDLFPISLIDNWQELFIEYLSVTYLEKDCDICNNKVPAEGIVVRKEVPFEIEIYKHKSFRFFEHETKLLDSGEIDMETAESLANE